MPNSIRPGDVLAGRYRLVDLLAESEGGRFWRAHDRVLERHVALHVIDADDERASGLLEAARTSATVPDRRLLRVLDADQADGLCYVVNEWGAGSSLDVLVSDEGPLAPRRAAWLVSEVAAALAAAHQVGVAHGRLAPENVLVDRSGSVRVIGFCVDAALHGLPAGRVAEDVADLGGLLYCALTGRWPGPSPSSVPPAPREHGRVLRPRQVRAGIPRALDLVCDTTIHPHVAPNGRAPHDLTTSAGVRDALQAFVGDPSGLAEAEAPARQDRDRPRSGTATQVIPALPHPPVRLVAPSADPVPDADPAAVHEPTPGPVSEPVTDPVDESVPTPDEAVTDERPASVDLPTQAGLPIFDDEHDDVSWLTASPGKAPPPPPFEPAPERPLFAPEPTDGRPARQTRPQASPSSAEYWPWGDTGTGTGTTAVAEEEDDEVPGRSWLRLALGILLALLLMVGVVVAYNLGRGKSPLGQEPDQGSGSRSTSPSASAAPLTGLHADDFDPQGSPPEENPDLAPLAVDGDPSTAWRTMTYTQDLGPGGLKTGVGLVVDLGATHDVSSVDLTMVGAPTDVALYVTDSRPTGVKGLTPAARATVQTKGRITLDSPVSGRYLVVWLTSLPHESDGYRGEVAEVGVRG
ncbi:MAG: protein kinase domain-containing protein [Nocardioides sp.]